MSKEQVDVDALFKADGSREKLKKDLAAYHEISVEEASGGTHGVRPYLWSAEPKLA